MVALLSSAVIGSGLWWTIHTQFKPENKKIRGYRDADTIATSYCVIVSSNLAIISVPQGIL